MNEIATEFFRFCNSRHITSRDLDEYIRKNDINPTITDNLGRTVLHICSKNANADVVLHLLRNYNLNPNIADILGRTPICETVICLGSTANVCQTIKHLAQFGANLNHISDDGYNSLQFALEMHYWDVARTLVNCGIRVHDFGAALKSPLHYFEKYPIECSFLREYI